MNVVRVVSIVLLVVLAFMGRRRFRQWLNPVTILCLPFAGTLAIGEFFLRGAPFGDRAALLIVGASACFALGSFSRKPGLPTGASISMKYVSPNTRRLYPLALIATLFLLLAGVRFVRGVYDGSSVAYVGDGMYDRGLAVASLRGTAAELVVRIVTLVTLLAPYLVILPWFSRSRERFASASLYGLSVLGLSLATRSRFTSILVIITCALLISLTRANGVVRSTRRHHRRSGPILLLIATTVACFWLFSLVALARYGFKSGSQTTDFLYATAAGPSALSAALDRSDSVEVLDGLGQSVAGLLDILQVRGRTLGSYSSVQLGDSDESVVNIFTGIYPLVKDVGVVLTLVLFGAGGSLGTGMHRRLSTSPSPARLVRYVNYLLLIACMPVALIASYNFWWVAWLASPLANLVFKSDEPSPTTFEMAMIGDR